MTLHSVLRDPIKKTEHMAPASPPVISVLFLLLLAAAAVPAQLRPKFYSTTCPDAETIVWEVMRKAMIREPRSVASVMRFQFHDCFVNVRNRT